MRPLNMHLPKAIPFLPADQTARTRITLLFNTWNIQATGYAEVDLLKHLTARTSLSYTTVNDYNKTIIHNQYFDIIGHNLPNGDAENSSYSSTTQWTNTLEYYQQWGDHSVKL